MFEALFRQLGLTVFERGWLSSNNVLFPEGPGGAVLVDSGYSSHADQTVGLVRQALGSRPLSRVVNTHLHSDHCGGNAALQLAFDCSVTVPRASWEAVRDWDESRLTYRHTGQTCPRFLADQSLEAGDAVRLGTREWRVLAAPGHDPEAVMFFEPESRVLISGDALWEDRLAIVFPELENDPGFASAEEALDCIAKLNVSVVIPGHGRPFDRVEAALASSRSRLRRFAAEPERHLRYGARALVMFHMLERRRRRRGELVAWLSCTPIFLRVHGLLGGSAGAQAAFGEALIDGLLADGLLASVEDDITLPDG